MGEEVYKSKCLDLSVKCGTAAAAMGVKCFVEVSHGQVYKSSKAPCGEDAPIKPWTKHATYKHQAEEALRQIDGLPLVVLRLATVYGNGDVNGLMPRVVIAAAYKQLGETMKVRLFSFSPIIFYWRGAARAWKPMERLEAVSSSFLSLESPLCVRPAFHLTFFFKLNFGCNPSISQYTHTYI